MKPPISYVLMGVDPGTIRVGWGVVKATGTALELLDCGAIQTPAKKSIEFRLEKIYEGLEAVVTRYHPVGAALEETFAGQNMKAAISMGQGRGVAMLALVRGKVPIVPLSPNEIKKAVTGQGHADKQLVARMVCARLNIGEVPEPADITDALAAAIALSHRLPRSGH